MFAIAGISSTGTRTPRSSMGPEDGDQQDSQPQTKGGNADQPAVIVSMSNEAAAALQAAAMPLALNPDQVDSVLSWPAAAGEMALLYEHADRVTEVDKFGQITPNGHLAGFLDGVVAGMFHALSYASSRGIPTRNAADPNRATSFGPINVGAFSFTNGGSTYSVMPTADGNLVGTRDGLAWKTWQLAGPTDRASTARAERNA
jgi:hypothetical protein